MAMANLRNMRIYGYDLAPYLNYLIDLASAAARRLSTHVDHMAPPKHQEFSLTTYSWGLAFVLCLSSVAILCCRKRSNKDAIIQGRMALGALLSVITPTRSTWPMQYSSLALTTPPAQRTLKIPLTSFYFDVLNGSIELRDPISDMPLLLDDKLITASGFSVSLSISFSWWLKFLWWVISCESIVPDECEVPLVSELSSAPMVHTSDRLQHTKASGERCIYAPKLATYALHALF